MNQILRTFLAEDQGQDLIEYTLLMAFVALASAALFIGAGGSIKHDLDGRQLAAWQRSGVGFVKAEARKADPDTTAGGSGERPQPFFDNFRAGV